ADGRAAHPVPGVWAAVQPARAAAVTIPSSPPHAVLAWSPDHAAGWPGRETTPQQSFRLTNATNSSDLAQHHDRDRRRRVRRLRVAPGLLVDSPGQRPVEVLHAASDGHEVSLPWLALRLPPS